MRRSALETLERRNLLAAIVWSSGPSLPAARTDAAAVVTSDNVVRVLGGDSAQWADAPTLAPGATAWGAGPKIDTQRNDLGAVVSGNSVLLLGGTGNTEGMNEVLSYDYRQGDSQDLAKMSRVRYDFAYAADNTGRAYAIGGIGVRADGQVWSQAERFDPATGAWTSIASLPQALHGSAAIGDGSGHIFVFGGSTTLTDAGIQASVLRYDVASDAWSTVAPMPVGTRDSAVVSDDTGAIYVLGGVSSTGTTDAVQVYDPTINAWSSQTALPAPVSSVAAAFDSQSSLVVAGGFDANGVATAAVYQSQRLDLPQTVPQFTSSAVVDASLDTLYEYNVDAVGNPSPSYSLVSSPAGMSINAATGLITWQPVAGQVGTQSVTVRATNAAGTADQSFSIAVVADTIAPTVPANFAVTSTTETTATFSWGASTDAVGVDHYDVFTARRAGTRFHKYYVYTLVDTVAGTTSTVGGLTPLTSQSYTVEAVDATGNRSGKAAFVTATTLSAPNLTFQFGAQTSGTVQSPAKSPVQIQLQSRANPNASFSLVSGPSTMTVDAATGVVQWTPTVADIGLHDVTFRATNSVGSADLIVSIDVTPDAPVLSVVYNPTSGGARYAVAGTLFSAQINDASSTPSNYSLVAAPVGMTIDATSGQVSWTPTGDQGGTHTVTVQATNAGGSSNLSFDVLTHFTGGVGNIAVTGETLLEPTVTWTPPIGEGANLVTGYQINAFTRYRWGSHTYSYRTHSVDYVTSAGTESVLLTGLLAGKTYTITITPVDAAGNTGLPDKSATVTSVPALPQVRWLVNGQTGGTSVPGTSIAQQPVTIELTDYQTIPSTLSLVSGPAGMTFDPATNTANWVPLATDVGLNNITFRATNSVGPVDVVVPVNVLFSGSVRNATATKQFGTVNATASWDPPIDNVFPVASYEITMHWKWQSRNRSRSWTVPGTTTSTSIALYPTGAVSHKGIRIVPIDANGNRGLDSGLIVYGTSTGSPPTVVNDHFTATEDTPLSVPAATGVLANDSDPDGGSLTARLAVQPTNGTVTLAANGGFTYTPNANFNGLDSFTYYASDGLHSSGPATATIDVAAVNDAPTALYDYYATNGTTPLNITAGQGLLANDTDVDGDVLSAVLVNGPTHGTLTLNPNGSFGYVPNAGFGGVDQFQYRANDGVLDSNLSTVSVTVNGAPSAADDVYTATEDTPLVVTASDPNVLYLETFDGFANPSPLSAAGWSIITGTRNPTVVSTDFAVPDNLNVNKITSTNDGGFQFNSGHVFLEHDINEMILAQQGFGETFIYTDEVVSQNGGVPLDLNGGHLFVDYANGDKLNSGPYFQFAIRTGTGWYVIERVQNLTAAQDIQTATASTDPLSSTVSVVPIQLSPGAWAADVRILYQGSLTRTLSTAELANITGVGILTGPRSDGSPARFDNFAVTMAATPPSLLPGLLANDSDPDGDPLAATLVSGPAHGTVSVQPDGSFRYAPNANYNGQDSFTYQVSDGVSSSNVAVVNINVTPVNDAPVAAADQFSTDQDVPLTVGPTSGVLANDSDIDGDTLIANLVTGPTNGTLALSADGSFLYTPNAGFNGIDSFSYTANDGALDSPATTVSVAVNSLTPPTPTGTKFYVVEFDNRTTFEYDTSGAVVEQYSIPKPNKKPVGVTTNLDGSLVWVVDKKKLVAVYDNSGQSLGNWQINGLDKPDGIATDGTDIWIVDRALDRVFRFAGGSSLRSGSAAPTDSFPLARGNTNPKGLTTDGNHLWVVNSRRASDEVFQYDRAGALLGRWKIDPSNSSPTGITIDPGNVQHIWIVDSGTDRVYQYNNGATQTAGAMTASTSFALAPSNINPQGIADPVDLMPLAESAPDPATGGGINTASLPLPRLTRADNGDDRDAWSEADTEPSDEIDEDEEALNRLAENWIRPSQAVDTMTQQSLAAAIDRSVDESMEEIMAQENLDESLLRILAMSSGNEMPLSD